MSDARTVPGAEEPEPTLTPTEDLIVEVLAARWRGGDREWPFENRHRPALRRLEAAGLVTVRSGPVQGHVFAHLTDAGCRFALNPSYLEDVEWFRPTAVPELRRRIDALMRREDAQVYPQDPRAWVPTPVSDLWQSHVDSGDVPVLQRFLSAARARGDVLVAHGSEEADAEADRRQIAEFIGVDPDEMAREQARQQAAAERYPDPKPRR